MKLELILSEAEVRQLRDTLRFSGEEAALYINTDLSDGFSERCKFELNVCSKVIYLLDLALKEHKKST